MVDAVSEEMDGTSYKLDELAEAADVSTRTVRYYVQRGLLPAPVFRGRDTAYSGEHLLRLQAIRRLQERFLPLDAIQAELERCSLDDLRRLAEGRDEPARTVVASPVVAIPCAPPSRAPGAPRRSGRTPPRAERWDRWELAPGVELHVAEGAGAAARVLVDELRALAERRQGHKG
jgi:DNA-binding transcriptional MerR regulator